MLPIRRMPLFVWLLAAIPCAQFQASAQTEEQVRLAFRNIRSDDIPHNASIASAWIYRHRNQLTRELLDELYRTDRQGREAILHALMDTKSFQPDARFCRTLVSRLNEEDNLVPNRDLRLYVHWLAWRHIDKHYELYKPLLLENLQTTNDMWCIWATVSLLHKHSELTGIIPSFSPHVWDTAANSLRSDRIVGNAGQAVRFYLIIGKTSLPYLQPLTKSSEAQTRNFASATIDAMGGSRRAYGYLGTQIAIDRDIFPGGTGSPEWMYDEVQKWSGGERYR